MFRPLPLYIGLRYIYAKNSDRFGYFVAWLSTIGLTLGAFALIVVLSVMNGFEEQMQSSILRFMPQAQITTQQQRIQPQQYPASQFLTLPGVTAIHPFVTSDVILQSGRGITASMLMGIDPNTGDEPIAPYVYPGELASLQAGQYQVIIGETLAEQLEVNIGDPIRLMVTQASQITPVGRIPSQRLFTISGIYSVNSNVNSAFVYVNQTDAARLLRLPKDTFSSWRLFMDNPLEINQLVKQTLPAGLQFKDWRIQRGELFQAVKMEKNMMSLLISLIVIVAAFNIITSLGLLVMEKAPEVAILKTLGLTRRKIMQTFIVQGASSGIVGTLLGAIAGVIVANHLNSIMQTLGLSIADIQLPSLVVGSQVITIVLALILLSVLATLYPAWRAAQTDPAEALRYE